LLLFYFCNLGVPATVIHPAIDNRLESVIVAETVQAFITTMDALKLGQKAVDEIQPLVSDLMGSLAKIRSLPSDFEGLIKIKLWLQKLNEMRAADEIEEVEIRQLLFDLESSYSAFHKHLSSK
jgi:ESCRT-I complex subunit VPS28